ncbi:MAG: NUDIX hydrolase [Verrucomicrobiae bacterium]|nr:NUDIX hydrolase [Verrucomicrobiae bacterium]
MTGKKILFQGKHINLVAEGRWEFAERPRVCGIVFIAAMTPEKRVIMVEQYRPPVGRIVVELPAGLAGDIPGQEHEDLAVAARRELLEETGYEAAEMHKVMEGVPSAGICSEVLTLFVATGLRKVSEGGGDAHEQITVHEVPIGQMNDWLAAQTALGKTVDYKVYAGLWHLETLRKSCA